MLPLIPLLSILLILPAPGLGQSNQNITWVMEKIGHHPSFVTYGTQLRFRVTGTLPNGMVTEVRAEIYTPSDSISALFSLCSPQVISIGPNLLGSNMTELNNQWILEAKGNDYRNERASLTIVNLTSVGSSALVSDNQIVFEFTSKVLNSPRMVNNMTYNVSFGARYDNNSKIWIGQASYAWSNLTGNSTTTTNSLTLSGPSSLRIGETGVFTVTFRTGAMLNQLILDIFSPFNSTDLMSICYVGIGDDTGKSFSCGSTEGNLTYPKRILVDPDSGEYYNSIATFDAGELINGEFRTMVTSAMDDTITFKIAVRMLSACVPGTEYKIGVAAQHNFAQIWIDNLNVTAVAANWSTPIETLPTANIAAKMDQIRIGASTSVFVNISTPRNTTFPISVELSLPFNDTQAIMAFQRLRVVHVGRNMPCIYYSNKSIATASSVGDSVKDHVTFNLGMVTNLGIRSGLYDDTIAMEFSVLLLNHSLIASGGEVKVIVGARFGSIIWVAAQNFTVVTSQQIYPATKLPRVSFSNLMSTENIYNGTANAFLVEIYQPVGTQFENMEIEIETVMDNNRAVLSICNVQIVHIGSHFVNISEKSLSVINVSTADDGRVNKVLIKFPGGFLSNVGYMDYPWLSEKNSIRFNVFAFITPHYIVNASNLFSNTLYWISCRITNTPSVPFAKQFNLRYDPVTMFNSVSIANQSVVTTARQTPNTTVWVGGSYTMLVNMTSVPQAYGHYSIYATSLSENLNICRIGLSKRGRNIPCLGSMISPSKALFANSESVRDYTLDLLNFANFGQTNRLYSGSDNSALFDVVFQLTSGTTGLKAYGRSSFNLGSSTIWTDAVNLTANATLPEVNFSPKFNIQMRNNSDQVVVNGFHTVELEGYLPVDTIGNYTVDFLVPFNSSDHGKMHICSLRLVTAGWNLPCVNDSRLSRRFYDTYSTGVYDRAEIALGLIQNIAITGPVEQVDNKIRIEAEIFINGSLTSPGETLWIGALVNISNSRIWVGSKSITVVSSMPSLEKLRPSVAVTDRQPIGMRIFEERLFTFNISMAEALTNMSITIFTNVSSGEAVFTLRDFNLSFIGSNFCCLDRVRLVFSNESTLGNSQADRLTVSGIIANSGIWRRYQWAQYKKDHDVIQLQVKARLTDHTLNFIGAVQNIYCQLTYNGLTVIGKAPVQVIAAPEDKPQLQIFQTEILTLPLTSKTPGTQLQLNIRLNHTENSRGNAYNVNLYWYLPYILGYTALVQSAPGSVTIVNKTDVNEGLVISIPSVFYTEEITVTVNVTVDPRRTLSIGSGITPVTLLADAFYTCRNKSAGLTSIEALSTYTPTYRNTIEIYIPDCYNPLGMESGGIQDCQITASGHLGSDVATKGRYNSDRAWSSPHRGPPFYGSEYLEISLGNRTRVTAVRLQGHGSDANNRVDTFWLQHSEEGLLWFDFTASGTGTKETFNASYNGGSAYVTLSRPVATRFIRLLPLAGAPSRFSRSLRVELYGCRLTEDNPVAEACYEMTATVPGASPQGRGYVVNPADGVLFVCMLNRPGGHSRCSRTADFGATWERLDDLVSQIGFVQPAASRLYGTSYDHACRVRSDDGGWTWSTVSEEEYAANLPAGRQAVEVPWWDFSSSNASALFGAYGLTFNSSHAFSVDMQGLHLSTDGLNRTWTLITYWSQHGWI